MEGVLIEIYDEVVETIVGNLQGMRGGEPVNNEMGIDRRHCEGSWRERRTACRREGRRGARAIVLSFLGS